MENFKKLTTKEKALQLNLDEKIYGTIAEIGGGQDVAAHFCKAGGASGSIAKTMSAYDMTFSDAIYGKADRYVSEDKLHKMLNKEYSLLSQRLTNRAKRSTFFAFANTVETINFKKSNEGHGWIGLRFQKHPLSEANTCILHVWLRDNDAEWQQQVLGILGVNLIHSCFHKTEPEDIMLCLRDNLSKDRLEIDMFSISGPDFHHVDNRLMSLLLVKHGLTDATLFGPKGNVLQPSEILYKKNIVVLRGRFRPVTHVHVDMMLTGLRRFKKIEEVDPTRTLPLTELNIRDLQKEGEIDEADFMDRVDCLCALGQTVLISNYQEHYRLAAWLSKFTKGKKLGIICGLSNLEQIFDEKYYDTLKGGILESFSRLFGSHAALLVYPVMDHHSKVKTLEDFIPKNHLRHLFIHFKENQQIVSIEGANEEILSILSDDILKNIKNDSGEWQKYVPQRVQSLIRQNHMFDLPYAVTEDESPDFLSNEQEPNA